MSLINDALKRASQVPPPPSDEAGDLQPVPEPAAQSSSNIAIVLFPILLFVILALAAFFIVRGLDHKDANVRPPIERVSARERPTEATVKPQETPVATPAKDPPVAKMQAPPERNVAPEPAPTVVSPAIAMTAPVVVPAPQPNPGQLRVQGIFYRPKNPAAVINSKMVHVGDQIGDAKVVGIDQQSVTIESDGSRKILTMF